MKKEKEQEFLDKIIEVEILLNQLKIIALDW